MKKPLRFLSVDNVIELNRRTLEREGGASSFRDLGLLESAVTAPRQTFGGEYLHPDGSSMAAAYLYHLVKNHIHLKGFTAGEIDTWNKNLSAVEPHGLLKIFLIFPNAWWGDKWSTGKVVTDLPLRQVYYFGRRDKKHQLPSVLMASYADARFRGFWEPLRRSKEKYGRESPELNLNGLNCTKSFGMPSRMVDKVLGFLKLLHPNATITDPITGFLMDWGVSPLFRRMARLEYRL